MFIRETTLNMILALVSFLFKVDGQRQMHECTQWGENQKGASGMV